MNVRTVYTQGINLRELVKLLNRELINIDKLIYYKNYDRGLYFNMLVGQFLDFELKSDFYMYE